MTYEPPTVTELGSLHELTLQQGNNKIGFDADQFTNQTGLVGSIVPPQQP